MELSVEAKWFETIGTRSSSFGSSFLLRRDRTGLTGGPVEKYSRYTSKENFQGTRFQIRRYDLLSSEVIRTKSHM